ncbi:hypothetical protein K8W59_05345 [Nocardioides rotundus]|uniref:RHS repeat-associated core domain-containing protein n=1 Tax=Nocardioides rotundus TaxID=1774216 RepID=UPI001CBB7519|nr:RHS repeat-associated core domain-containing protein [Nocardioides rotundus]UAL30922.1 hypothetical protein K8W59_05345 [Nocardioides rotundus]
MTELPWRLRGLVRVVVLVLAVTSVLVASWPAGAAPSGGVGGGCACASTSGGSPYAVVRTVDGSWERGALKDTDGQGETRATYGYTAYGNPEAKTTTGEDQLDADGSLPDDPVNPLQYQAQRLNPATGDYDTGFRNYAPGINRFLSRDMYNGALPDAQLGTDPWNTNRYTFTGGNPLTYADLDGHKAESGGVGYNTEYYKPPSDDGWGQARGRFPQAGDGPSGVDRAIEGFTQGATDTVKSAAKFAADTVKVPFSAQARDRMKERGANAWYAATNPIETVKNTIASCTGWAAAQCAGSLAVGLGPAGLGKKLLSQTGHRRGDSEPKEAADTGPLALPIGPWGQRVVDARNKLPSSWGPGLPNSKKVGTRWFDPAAPKANGVRIDQGSPGSLYPSQQVDHVIVRSGGNVLGPDGLPITGSIKQNPQAHIPLDDWLSWSSWNAP